MVGVKRVKGHHTQSRGDTANVETEQAKQRQHSVLPVSAAATGNIITCMHCVTVCVHVCDNVFFCSFDQGPNVFKGMLPARE